jgi:redox-sensitive bicupin YhaK (pirin superfamily)
MDGGCQWMTAGSGIIHQEMPKPSARMLGAQLWINLPAKDKMTPPAYNGIHAADVPQIKEDGAVIRVISGGYRGTQGAFQGKFVDATYLDVSLEPGVEWMYESVPENTLFIYTYMGDGYFEKPYEALYPMRRALLFSHGRDVRIKAGEKGMGFLLLTAKPLGEPIAWGGPIVMNTPEELNQAFQELRNETFVK